MTTLSKEQLLVQPGRNKTARVDVPEWGEDAHLTIGMLSGLDSMYLANLWRKVEQDDLEGVYRYYLRVAERSVIQDGQRVFADGELDQANWAVDIAHRIMKAAEDLITSSAEGNLESSQQGSSRAA